MRCSVMVGMIYLCAMIAQAGISLVQEGKNPIPIYLPANAAKQETTAAEQLAFYLGKISGAKFTVQPAVDPLPASAILVGAFDPTLTQGLNGDGFIIKTVRQQLYIAGGAPLGTIYGVYELLEQLGCRWWSSSEEDIPSLPTVRIDDLNIVSQSPFTLHNIMSLEASHFAAKSRMTGVESFTGSHNLYPLLKSYAATHPEIFPLNKAGERKANNLHLCYLAPGIAEALAEALARQVESHNGNVRNFIYFAGMGDWYGGMCECQECKSVYEEESWTDPDGRVKPGYTATLLRMINKTAEILEQRYPGIKVGTFAYMSLEAPPAKTVPRHNVTIRVPRLRHCTVHAATECDKNTSYRRNLERWCAIAPGRVYIWEYGVNYANFIYPFPCVHSMAENVRYYRTIGVKGVMIQGNYVTTGGDLVVLKNYLWSKLLWNPDRDEKAVLQEFCDGYYGPASQAMLAYVTALERSVREPDMRHADEFVKSAAYLTKDARVELHRLRAQAISSAGGKEPYDRRVREATNGLEVLTLDTASSLIETQSQLARTDSEDRAYERALAAARYNRNTGNNEWSTGRGYWMRFLAIQGGPLVTLTQSPITVKVAPVNYGQIRQISYKERPLLFVESDVNAKGYPALGGSIVNGFGSTPMRVVDEPTDTAVKLQYGLGVEKWRFGAQQSIWQTIAIEKDNTLIVNGTAAARTKIGPFSIATTYLADTNFPGMRIEYLTADNQWKTVALSAANPQVALLELPELVVLRITTPEKGCTIIDRYITPQVTGASIAYDPGKRTITTVMHFAGGITMRQNAPTFLTRTMQLMPL